MEPRHPAVSSRDIRSWQLSSDVGDAGAPTTPGNGSGRARRFLTPAGRHGGGRTGPTPTRPTGWWMRRLKPRTPGMTVAAANFANCPRGSGNCRRGGAMVVSGGNGD
ncbi:hypothetical protein GCM10010211_58510 [Streptomyces albospinus]|uniref:Uncharacterized protein n=1 Tax=Streptomyces albospinus TaxID=285515 RepID=A0ABQ2VFR6_9ACTN|nr:hypothetical protein GCM10010211_58510 [Streptomyces albospinus]